MFCARNHRFAHSISSIGIVLTGAVLLLAATVGGTIINVPVDYPTIQEGIDNSSDLDTVLVAPGHYVENINFKDKEIVLSSHFLFDQDPDYIYNTIIDGSNQAHPDTGSTVLILNGAVLAVTLQGFTITGGSGTHYEWSPGNWDKMGGGVFVVGSKAKIQYNCIRNNIMAWNSSLHSAGGGGIYIQNSQTFVWNNIIVENYGKNGAGIGLAFGYNEIRNNIIAYNYGGEVYGGSGIQINQGWAFIINNTIVGNISAQSGGGLRTYLGDHVLRNNIIWYNEAPSNEQIEGFDLADYNNIHGGGGVTGTGNIDVEPKLSNCLALCLLGDSPCIDAGSPDSGYYDPETPWMPDSARWPSRGGLRNDMGAHGGPGAFPIHPVHVFADTDFGWAPMEVAFDVSSWYQVDAWHWEFDDGDTVSGQTPTHIFETPGIHDVTVQTTVGGEYRDWLFEGRVVTLADSLIGDSLVFENDISCPMGIVIDINAKTNIALNSIIIPVVFAGDVELVYDSFSTVGCRTVDFGYQNITHFLPSEKCLTIKLLADTSPTMDPGEGPILKLYFTRQLELPANGDRTVISLEGYPDHTSSCEGPIGSYEPALINGSITYVSCCVGERGNIDADSEDNLDITDLVFLVDYMFNGSSTPPCFEEADMDASEGIDISDLVYLVDYMFNGGQAPLSCS